ncbi:sugar ABC transporter ATP-binding protein [Christensenella timonensis]|uniref:sugar ABC transporter ATP-binding protein n=1 Tax=Christensenella timonensis TaxID=1816678 RepID=UPI00082C89EC|nr:sugar ABC transporter ATP-binding protein [Christensenella timonensis]
MNNARGTPVLEVKGVSKAYAGVTVLSEVDFDLYPGEVHALIGENGAGKSTLSKIISGVTEKSAGTMYRNGQEYNPVDTHDANRQGISIVHQEFNLIPVLSVAQNICLGKEHSKGGFIDEKESARISEDMLKKLELDIPVKRKVRYLSVAQQQLVEITKCLCENSDIIIMDEPTATLTLNETKQLFKIIKSLQEKGVSIIYISHKLEEIFAIAQRITVLRDGQKVGTYGTEELDEEKLVTLMVGREISSMYEHKNTAQDEVVLKAEHLTKAGLVGDVSFELKKGEILGFGGLVGAGRTELMKMIFGEYPIDAGSVELFGKKIAKPKIKNMVENGLVYLSESRKEEGILANMQVKDNITLAVLKSMVKGLFISPQREKKLSKEMIGKLDIKTQGLSQKVGHLSGGNQQKVVLAKWLATDVKVLILDEPTRGIDVGAKHEIYKLMNELCAKGISIIMISSEMPELIGMCDRLIVMSEGRMTAELRGDEIQETAIMNAAIQRGYKI